MTVRDSTATGGSNGPVVASTHEHRPATAAGRAVRRSVSDALVEMYDSLDSDDRAQGVPPLTGDRIQSWLADLLAEGCNLFFGLKPDQKSLIKTF